MKTMTDDDVIAGIFPMGFSSVSALLFLVPSFTLIYISMQPALGPFVRPWAWMVLLIPLVLVIAHVYHVKRGPHRYITWAAVAVPSLLLMVLSGAAKASSSSNVQSLFSIDCDIMPEKVHLQLEWEA